MSLHRSIKSVFHPHRGNSHRPRLLHPRGLTSLAVIAVLFFVSFQLILHTSSLSGSVLGYASSITASQVLDDINAQRAAQGLPQLVSNPQLNQAALAKGQDMFSQQYWSHTSPAGVAPWSFIKNAGYSYKAAGENLARDFQQSSEMVDAWMASPTHKQNILNQQYSETGIAVIDGTLEGYETTLVVQMFGSPRSTVTAIQRQAVSATAAEIGSDDDKIVPALPILQVQAADEAQVEFARVTLPSEVVLAELQSADRPAFGPYFTPLQLTKAVFLGIVMLISTTLLYDSLVIGNRAALRLVGQNTAHLLLFFFIAFLLIFYKGGIIG
ncbi:MAG: CAP domain-containing protein [bacterium]|nr:CAP domain-containing protein [bacterium]